MAPHVLLVIGIAAGFIPRALLNELFRWTPSWRDLLTALAMAVLIDLAISSQTRRDLDVTGVAATHPAKLPSLRMSALPRWRSSASWRCSMPCEQSK
jgi:hypothetical protein